jgi:glycosyltransferase involved in cell wall biosynthesis
MAAGSPVVASRSGGVVETVKDRDTGFIVEKNDPEQLACTLLRLLQDDELRERMGRAGRERALARFTWDMVADTMLSRYRSLSGFGASMPSEAPLTSLMEYASADLAS